MAGWRFAEKAGERGDGFEQQGVEAGLLVGATAGAEPGDGTAVFGVGGELVDPGGDGGVNGRAGRGGLVPGELGDGFFGAGIIDQVFAGCRGGDEGGGGGVVEGPGQPAGDPV